MAENGIYAIGYGNRPWEVFLALLQQYGITLLADIRTLPFSRFNPAYRKAALEKELEMHGIKYRFMGDALGGRPKDPVLYTRDKVDYRLVATSPLYREGIETLLEWRETDTVCIMCSELQPEHCHRKRLVGQTLEGMDVPVYYIDGKGKIQEKANLLF